MVATRGLHEGKEVPTRLIFHLQAIVAEMGQLRKRGFIASWLREYLTSSEGPRRGRDQQDER